MIEALTKTGVGNARKILTRVSHSEIEDINDDANSANINEMAIAEGFKGEVSIQSILVVIIANIGSAVDAGLNMGSAMDAWLLPIGNIGVAMTEVVKSKIKEVLTQVRAGITEDTDNKANNASTNKIAAGWQ